MSGDRDLEREARRSIRRRAARAFPPRWWRSHRMALALAPLALVGGVATPATPLGHGVGNEHDARRLAFQAVKDTSREPACKMARRHDASIVDEPPPPTIATALPELGRRRARFPPSCSRSCASAPAARSTGARFA